MVGPFLRFLLLPDRPSWQVFASCYSMRWWVIAAASRAVSAALRTWAAHWSIATVSALGCRPGTARCQRLWPGALVGCDIWVHSAGNRLAAARAAPLGLVMRRFSRSGVRSCRWVKYSAVAAPFFWAGSCFYAGRAVTGVGFERTGTLCPVTSSGFPGMCFVGLFGLGGVHFPEK